MVTGGMKAVAFDRLSCEVPPRTAWHGTWTMARSKSSARWLREHFSDPYVRRAHADGWRSRSVFKLEEILERDRLLKPGKVVVDLGAAPGGWSQIVRRRLGDSGRVIALDVLPMQAIEGVEIVLGDFRDEAVLGQLNQMLGGAPVDLVLSDMAPNLSGMNSVDQPRSMHLVELAEEFADSHLRAGGSFVAKLFHGTGFDTFAKRLREAYEHVSIRKPKASRARSPEVYALATGKRG